MSRRPTVPPRPQVNAAGAGGRGWWSSWSSWSSPGGTGGSADAFSPSQMAVAPADVSGLGRGRATGPPLRARSCEAGGAFASAVRPELSVFTSAPGPELSWPQLRGRRLARRVPGGCRWAGSVSCSSLRKGPWLWDFQVVLLQF